MSAYALGQETAKLFFQDGNELATIAGALILIVMIPFLVMRIFAAIVKYGTIFFAATIGVLYTAMLVKYPIWGLVIITSLCYWLYHTLTSA